jgi:hypothetical protein
MREDPDALDQNRLQSALLAKPKARLGFDWPYLLGLAISFLGGVAVASAYLIN